MPTFLASVGGTADALLDAGLTDVKAISIRGPARGSQDVRPVDDAIASFRMNRD